MCVSNQTSDKNSTEIHLAPLGLVLGGISFITIVMNILVLYAVKTERKLHTVGNLYIVSLSCADLIVGAAVMPLNIVYLLKDEWLWGRETCLFWLSMDYVASTASIFSLFILCIDRFRSVQQPLKYLKYRTKTRATIMISGAWLLSFMWVIPILGWHNFANKNSTAVNNRTSVENVCETDFCKNTWFKVLTAIANFYIPSLMMLIFYARIYKTVRKHRALINGSLRASAEKTMHSGKVQEMQKISSPRPCKDTGYFCDKKNFNQNPETETKLSTSRFVKVPKVLHRGGDHEIVKLSCFPLAIAQNNTGTGNMDKKYAYIDISIRNAKKSCPQDFEVSKTSDEPMFAGRLSCRNYSDLTPEQNSCTEEQCFPQDKNSKDNAISKDTATHSYLKMTWSKLHTHSMTHNLGTCVSRDRKAAKQLGCIMAAFMVCWIPYFVFFLVMAYCPICYNRSVHMFTIWLGYVNSTLNPFIYPLCNENFKKTFKKIFHMKT